MLYLFNETQHTAMAPFNLWAKTVQTLITNPYNPLAYSPYGRTLAAGCELMERVTRRYIKRDFAIPPLTMGSRKVPVVEEVALRKPFCNLVHFRVDIDRKVPALLLLAPLSGNHATLLRDTVKVFLPECDVYISDWIDARMAPNSVGPLHLDDYVGYVQDFIDYLGEDVHVIAVSQASIPLLAAVALMATNNEPTPCSMTLIAGPIDTRISPTLVNQMAMQHSISWFRNNLIDIVPAGYPGEGRHVYPGFLQLAGALSVDLPDHADAYRDLLNNIICANTASAEAHRDFYDEYHTVMDVPADYFLETIKAVFHEHALAKGNMRVNGQLVNAGAIRHTALMTVEGSEDVICGVGQTMAAHNLCCNIPTSKREHYLAFGVTHHGLFDGELFREHVAPRISAFIHRHDKIDKQSGLSLTTTHRSATDHKPPSRGSRTAH
ncbi:MAG TPA: polyhydroxyalkanoate depolymerase [Burkholderiales bacterium]|jgi:poly(3-hydroxybutyrate) depolymerase|nr:polyhydroxyalkanoate depolymerase [Burkholderiales bacterium]